MNVFVPNRPPCRDKTPRQGFKKVEGAPSLYRARISPYKGRRTLVKKYP